MAASEEGPRPPLGCLRKEGGNGCFVLFTLLNCLFLFSFSTKGQVLPRKH